MTNHQSVTAIWHDGQLTFRPPTPPDPGLLSGMGVFETMTMLRGVPFAFTRHLARLQQGARRMGLPPPATQLIESACADLGRPAGRMAVARLRLTWTPGPAGAGTLLASVEPYTAPRDVRVLVSQYRRNERSAVRGIKTTSNAENLLSLARARAAGADEAILADSRGNLSEGATSNIFLEIDGELLTPPESTGCLPGVTRQLSLEWGTASGLPIREELLPLDVMNTTPHAAVTSALKGVAPVSAIGDRSVVAGPLTEELRRIYFQNRTRNLDP